MGPRLMLLYKYKLMYMNTDMEQLISSRSCISVLYCKAIHSFLSEVLTHIESSGRFHLLTVLTSSNYMDEVPKCFNSVIIYAVWIDISYACNQCLGKECFDT